jgi:hypothetical protein
MAALDDAFRLIDIGLPVFPVLGKRPPLKGGFHNATTDREQVRQWAKRWPRCGWAIPTGDIVVVVDVDIALAVPAELMETLESSPGPSVRTGSGGLHVWYRPPRPLRTRVRFVAGCDFKAVGGYVLVPHAVHPRTRQPYRWLTPPEVEVPALPDPLLALVAPVVRTFTRPRVLAPRTAVAALRLAEEEVANATPGDRNATLNRQAFRLGPFVKAHILDEQQVVAHLENAAQTAGLDPLEIGRTIQSGLNAGMEAT